MNEIEVARNYLETLLEIERADHDQILAYQYRLLESLCRHAAKTVPFYQNYTDLASPADPTTAAWRKLPLITRRDLVANGDALTTRSLPRNHGIVAPVQTGGSTGPAARVVLSTLESIARVVSTYRMFKSWNFDLSRPLFMIRKPQIGSDRKDGPGFTKWGYPWLPEDTLGPRHHLDISLPPRDQLGRLAGEAPAYLNTLPSNVLRLGLLARRDPSLASDIPIIISVAETLPPEVRQLARAIFRSRVINIFSSAEAGVIAIECPESGLLHIQSEAVLAEIVDDTGEPCATGQVGELVVTPLYNYATPLIRYASGDYVKRGPPCPCGSNLPTISRVLGRREHLLMAGRSPRRPADR